MTVIRRKPVLTAFAVVASFALSAMVSAQQSPQYKIAGVSRGMKGPEVKAKMAAAGYKLKSENRAESFSQLVAFEKAKATGSRYQTPTFTEPMFQTWEKPGEMINLWYVQAPSGNVVKAGNYQFSGSAVDPAVVKSTLVSRYGPPKLVVGPRMNWCAKPATGCKSNQEYMSFQSARVDIGGPTNEEGLRQLIADTARQSLPASKPSF